jgi:hypothetical protein
MFSPTKYFRQVPEAQPDRTREICSGDCLPKAGGAYYCYNLLGELDEPGEVRRRIIF